MREELKTKGKIKVELKIADEYLLDKLDSNFVVNHLEEQIKLREMPVQEQAKRMLKK